MEPVLSLPSRADAALDPGVRSLSNRWRMRVALAARSKRSSSNKDERRARRQEEVTSAALAKEERRARRLQEATRAALAAFAEAGPGHQRVLLVRHGEAAHNAHWKEHKSTPDTTLTEKGREQAAALASHPALVQCSLLVVSPLSRAIETAAAIFGERPACRACLCPLHSERCDGGAACNTGSSKWTLAERFPYVRAWEGFDELDDNWSPTAESDAHERWRTERVPAFLGWLAQREEHKVVVIGHGAFFHDPRLAGRMLANCEVAVLPVGT